MKLLESRKVLITILILLVGFAIALSMFNRKREENMAEQVYEKITQEEAKKMMDNDNVIILDVREKDEYATGHIENSILVPLSVLNDEIEKTIPNKDEVVLVYCRSGNRSKQASFIMSMLGYTNVYDFGGINTWEYGIVQD